MLAALLHAAGPAGIDIRETSAYIGASDWLLLWGPGHPARFGPMRSQLDRGGHVIALDLAYWSRDRKVRISIDAAHPQAWVMRRDWPTDRWAADPAPVADAWNALGPIIVAGVGAKARTQYGATTIDAWERMMITSCRARWDRPIWYRRKRQDLPVPDHVMDIASASPIDQVLTGASLLMTWHSNVAIDAIRMGIPVVCRDGAAAAVCPSVISETPVPLTPERRARFLSHLAYFQWAPSEAAEGWQFLRDLLR